MHKNLCAHCRRVIARGTRYSNRLTSVSVSDGIEIRDPSDETAVRKEVSRLVRSVDTGKSEEQLMEEVCVELAFELCRSCRDKFVSYSKNFAGAQAKH